MALIAPTAAGATITPVAAVGPDTYQNSGSERLYVVNGSGGALTITFDSQKACDQGVDHDTTFSVPAGATRLAPALSPTRYNNGSGLVTLTYSATASITVAVLQA